MNWRRGFIRLWLIISAIWISAAIFAFSLPHSLSNVLAWTEPAIGQSIKLSSVEAYGTAFANLRGFAFFGLGIPAAAFLLGIACWWVARGFKPVR